ncbi:MAG TPA: autotransporter [Conexibacter sp.]|nr:autotransporter [Conexibacter sp.]
MKRQSLRRESFVVMAALAALLLALTAGGVSSAAPSAHAARRLNLSGTAYLHLTRKSGNTLYESGTATGSLPGTVRARLVTGVTVVKGTVTFYPRGGGSLTLTARGYPQSAATIVHFTGTCAVRGGTGRFRRAVGSGSFSGTANRRTWAVTVHAHAQINY